MSRYLGRQQLSTRCTLPKHTKHYLSLAFSGRFTFSNTIRCCKVIQSRLPDDWFKTSHQMSSHFCLGSYCKEEFQQHDPLKHLDLLRFNTFSPMVKVLSPLTSVFSRLQSTPLGVKVCRYMVLRPKDPKDRGKQSDSRSEGHLGRGMTLRLGQGTTHPRGQWFTLGLRQGQSCLGLKEKCGM